MFCKASITLQPNQTKTLQKNKITSQYPKKNKTPSANNDG